jgi:hypothetical protein
VGRLVKQPAPPHGDRRHPHEHETNHYSRYQPQPTAGVNA